MALRSGRAGEGEVLEENSVVKSFRELWHKYDQGSIQRWNIEGVITRIERGVDRSWDPLKELERYQAEYEAAVRARQCG